MHLNPKNEASQVTHDIPINILVWSIYVQVSRQTVILIIITIPVIIHWNNIHHHYVLCIWIQARNANLDNWEHSPGKPEGVRVSVCCSFVKHPTHLPALVIIISVVALWNFIHRSLCNKVTVHPFDAVTSRCLLSPLVNDLLLLFTAIPSACSPNKTARLKQCCKLQVCKLTLVCLLISLSVMHYLLVVEQSELLPSGDADSSSSSSKGAPPVQERDNEPLRKGMPSMLML